MSRSPASIRKLPSSSILLGGSQILLSRDLFGTGLALYKNSVKIQKQKNQKRFSSTHKTIRTHRRRFVRLLFFIIIFCLVSTLIIILLFVEEEWSEIRRNKHHLRQNKITHRWSAIGKSVDFHHLFINEFLERVENNYNGRRTKQIQRWKENLRWRK